MILRAVIALTIAMALAGLWWHGYQKGQEKDRARSDAVIAQMVADAEERLAKANELIRQLNDRMQEAKEQAERELQNERNLNERRLADARAANSKLHKQLSDFASSPATGEDSVAACVDRARAIGDVLEGVLQGYASCTAAAEREAGNARGLLAAWPKVTQGASSPAPDAIAALP